MRQPPACLLLIADRMILSAIMKGRQLLYPASPVPLDSRGQSHCQRSVCAGAWATVRDSQRCDRFILINHRWLYEVHCMNLTNAPCVLLHSILNKNACLGMSPAASSLMSLEMARPAHKTICWPACFPVLAYIANLNPESRIHAGSLVMTLHASVQSLRPAIQLRYENTMQGPSSTACHKQHHYESRQRLLAAVDHHQELVSSASSIITDLASYYTLPSTMRVVYR